MKPRPKCPFYLKRFKKPFPAFKKTSTEPKLWIHPGKAICTHACLKNPYNVTCCMNCPKFLQCNRAGCFIVKQQYLLRFLIWRAKKDVYKYRHLIKV